MLRYFICTDSFPEDFERHLYLCKKFIQVGKLIHQVKVRLSQSTSKAQVSVLQNILTRCTSAIRALHSSVNNTGWLQSDTCDLLQPLGPENKLVAAIGSLWSGSKHHGEVFYSRVCLGKHIIDHKYQQSDLRSESIYCEATRL